MLIPHKPKAKRRFVNQVAPLPPAEPVAGEPVFGQGKRKRTADAKRKRRRKEAMLHPVQR